MKLLGRRRPPRPRRKALAAGTVSPDEVFATRRGVGTGDQRGRIARRRCAPPDEASPSRRGATSVLGRRPGGRAGADPITAPVPVIDAGPPSRRTARPRGPPPTATPSAASSAFGFDEGAGQPAARTPGVTARRPAAGLGAATAAHPWYVGDDRRDPAHRPQDRHHRGRGRPRGDRDHAVRSQPGRAAAARASTPACGHGASRSGGTGPQAAPVGRRGGPSSAVADRGRLVLESPLFAIDDVAVTGATYTDPARLQ